MNRLKLIFLSALLTVVVVGIGWSSAQCQSGQASQRAPMMKCQERFNSMDSNQDGMVTQEEFMAISHPGGRAEEIFKSRDKNGDGSLTQEEFCADKGMGRRKRQ